MTISSQISSEFCNGSKYKSETEIIHIFHKIKETKYKNTISIFTDGSHAENKTAAAMIVPSEGYSQSYRLPDHCSIMTAELYAITLAMKYCDGKENDNRYTIYTDSQSAVSLLLTNNFKSYRYFTTIVLTVLLKLQNRVSIQWIPSHKGILGNESADQLAKAALQKPICLLTVPTEDYFSQLYKQIEVMKQKFYVNKVNETKKGKKLMEIKDKFTDWPWACYKERAVETAVARLRVGHAGLAKYKFRFGLSASPLCECGDEETVDHFLLHCPLHALERQNLLSSLRREGISSPLTCTLLLGGSNLNAGKQNIVAKSLTTFLKNTDKIDSL